MLPSVWRLETCTKQQAEDRDIEILGVDIRVEQALGLAAREDGAQRVEQRLRHAGDDFRAPHHAPHHQVLAHDEADEIGIGGEEVEGQRDELAHRRDRVLMGDIEHLLALAYDLVGGFQRGEVEVVLAAEIMVDHADIDVGRHRDAVDAAAAIAVLGELGHRHIEDALARRHGIALGRRAAACPRARTGVSAGVSCSGASGAIVFIGSRNLDTRRHPPRVAAALHPCRAAP